MWKRADYELVVHTLTHGKVVIKALLERADLILENKIVGDPKSPMVKQWQQTLSHRAAKNKEVLESLETLPQPSDNPTEAHYQVLRSLSMGGPLEIAYNLPAGSRGVIGPIARSMLPET